MTSRKDLPPPLFQRPEDGWVFVDFLTRGDGWIDLHIKDRQVRGITLSDDTHIAQGRLPFASGPLAQDPALEAMLTDIVRSNTAANVRIYVGQGRIQRWESRPVKLSPKAGDV